MGQPRPEWRQEPTEKTAAPRERDGGGPRQPCVATTRAGWPGHWPRLLRWRRRMRRGRTGCRPDGVTVGPVVGPVVVVVLVVGIVGIDGIDVVATCVSRESARRAGGVPMGWGRPARRVWRAVVAAVRRKAPVAEDQQLLEINIPCVLHQTSKSEGEKERKRGEKEEERKKKNTKICATAS
jgi:hypothetical protein